MEDDDELFKPPEMDDDEYSPFGGNGGLFSGGRGLFDDDEVSVHPPFISHLINTQQGQNDVKLNSNSIFFLLTDGSNKINNIRVDVLNGFL